MKIINRAEKTALLEMLFSAAKEISTNTSEMTPEQTMCIEFLKKASGKEVSYETK